MSTLSSILRRLRTMPRHKLASRMEGLGQELRAVKPKMGELPSAGELRAGPRARMKARQQYLGQEGPNYHYAHNDRDTIGDYISEEDVKHGQTSRVMNLLRLLKKRGTPGYPPRRRM